MGESVFRRKETWSSVKATVLTETQKLLAQKITLLRRLLVRSLMKRTNCSRIFICSNEIFKNYKSEKLCQTLKTFHFRAVAIPEMLHACEVPLRIDKRVARFVIPFSVTLCANGSAVFIACSCLFISTFTGSAPTSAVVLLIGYVDYLRYNSAHV